MIDEENVSSPEKCTDEHYEIPGYDGERFCNSEKIKAHRTADYTDPAQDSRALFQQETENGNQNYV